MPRSDFGAGRLALAAVLLAAAYLPTLAARFDFIDDGNLVYPAPPMPAGERLALVWHKVVANYEHLGPFRPVLWVHWETQAEWLGANALAWRLLRLAWTVFAAAILLWLLRELRLRPAAALAATALALWNPYRGEIWTSLTLSEGVAMPYALFALVCAVRAHRSPTPGRWDLAGALAVVAALGCKNTFAALVPAQLLLRLAPDGEALRAAWRTHGRRALLLATTLLLPIGHFIVFKLAWRPGQYETGTAWREQVGGMARAVGGAVSPDMMALGVVATLVALAAGGRLGGVWQRHRGVLRAAFALLVCGFVLYLPIHGISGRYSIPSVWGLDLLFAVLVSELAELSEGRWRRIAWAGVVGGLAAVLVASVGRQQRVAARADVLWQALEHIERTAPPGACLGWVEGRGLNREEGIHFGWHLHARGRTDLAVRLLDARGNVLERRELPRVGDKVDLLIAGGPADEGAIGFTATYWGGRRRHDVRVTSVGDDGRTLARGDRPR